MNGAVRVSLAINTLGKGMNPSLLPPAIGKIIGQIGFSYFGWKASLELGKTLNLKPVECFSKTLCYCGTTFFCYQFIQKSLHYYKPNQLCKLSSSSHL